MKLLLLRYLLVCTVWGLAPAEALSNSNSRNPDPLASAASAPSAGATALAPATAPGEAPAAQPQPVREAPALSSADPPQATPSGEAPASEPAASSATPAAASTAASAPAAPTLPRARLDPDQDAERGDLWQRMRTGMALRDLQGDRVKAHERYYASKADYVQRMTARGSRYLFHIVEEVEKRGLPMELALLPFAESAFNPQALSSARASGIWQFMPATGKDFSLRQNLFRDDRRDVQASTRAALDYLERLHRLLGDWHLALAAYNWGQGNVLKAMGANRSRGLPTHYEALPMPEETRNYVPKLQAIKNYVMTPDVLGVPLPSLPDRPYFNSVSIDRDIDVDKLADMAGLSLEEFRALNPQLNKPVVLAAATPQVLLPYDNANRFLRALQRAGSSLATWTAWVAPRTLNTAEAARQVGMSVEDLRQVNRIPERMLVKAGSTLLVPRNARSQGDVGSHIADNATIMLAPEARPVRRVAFKVGRNGESVSAVAKRHGLNVDAVAAWNKTSPRGHFKPGQQVVVMLPQQVGRVVASARPALPPVAVNKSKATAPAKKLRVAAAPAREMAPKGRARSTTKGKVQRRA